MERETLGGSGEKRLVFFFFGKRKSVPVNAPRRDGDLLEAASFLKKKKKKEEANYHLSQRSNHPRGFHGFSCRRWRGGGG